MALAWMGVMVLNFISSRTCIVFSTHYARSEDAPLKSSEEKGMFEKNSLFSGSSMQLHLGMVKTLFLLRICGCVILNGFFLLLCIRVGW